MSLALPVLCDKLGELKPPPASTGACCPMLLPWHHVPPGPETLLPVSLALQLLRESPGTCVSFTFARIRVYEDGCMWPHPRRAKYWNS